MTWRRRPRKREGRDLDRLDPGDPKDVAAAARELGVEVGELCAAIHATGSPYLVVLKEHLQAARATERIRLLLAEETKKS